MWPTRNYTYIGQRNDSLADFLDSMRGPLKASEVSRILGLHLDTVYQKVREGEMPAANVGRGRRPVLRFHPQELASWLRDGLCHCPGPSQLICLWVNGQLNRGGPQSVPPLLSRVFELTGYAWLEAAHHVRLEPSLTIFHLRLQQDLVRALRKVAIEEQRQVLVELE